MTNQGQIVAQASVRVCASIPRVEYCNNIASVIDHSVGNYELVFDRPIRDDYMVIVSQIGCQKKFNYSQPTHDVMGVPSIIVEFTEIGEATVDASFDVIVLGEYHE